MRGPRVCPFVMTTRKRRGPTMRFFLALFAGIGGFVVGVLLSIGTLLFAGRLAGSLYALAAIFLAFPTVGFALAFQYVWIPTDKHSH
jgi:hypothetical protein